MKIKFKNRITYKNKAYAQAELFYNKQKGLHESDRIRLTIHPIGSEDLVVWMHALEAVDIIQMLSACVGEAMTKDLPLSSKD